MKIHELGKDPGRLQKRKRLGRGEGSGLGRQSGHGNKGSQQRSGRGKGYGGVFEGGQMPLQRRLPKRGFKNINRERVDLINLEILDRFDAGTVVDKSALVAVGKVRAKATKIKILGTGEITKAITVKAHAFSASAKAAIEAAGGTVEILK